MKKKPKQIVTPTEFKNEIRKLEGSGVFVTTALVLFNRDPLVANQFMQYARQFLASIERTAQEFYVKTGSQDVQMESQEHPSERNTKELIRDGWDHVAPHWITTESPMNYFLTTCTLLSEFVKDKHGVPCECLSLGAGPALYESFMTNLFGKKTGLSIVATDYSQGMVERAKAYAEFNKARSIMFQQVDMMATPYEENSFDLVIVNNSLGWVDDQVAAVAEIARVLKPDAAAYFVVHLHPMQISYQDETTGETHMHEFPWHDPLDLVEQHGLEVQFSRTLGSPYGQKSKASIRVFLTVRKRTAPFTPWRVKMQEGRIAGRGEIATR